MASEDFSDIRIPFPLFLRFLAFTCRCEIQPVVKNNGRDYFRASIPPKGDKQPYTPQCIDFISGPAYWDEGVAKASTFEIENASTEFGFTRKHLTEYILHLKSLEGFGVVGGLAVLIQACEYKDWDKDLPSIVKHKLILDPKRVRSEG